MGRTHRPLADRTGLNIRWTTNLLTVIAGHCMGLTKRLIAYHAIDDMCRTKPIPTNETVSEMFAAERIRTLVTGCCVVGTMRRLAS